ncbi:flagellar assembly protein FliH [Bacillus timonensis]|nr:flagellar assembly protein FliH [Bacillus timonensis]
MSNVIKSTSSHFEEVERKIVTLKIKPFHTEKSKNEIEGESLNNGEAEDILHSARKEAEKIIEEAKIQSQAIMNEIEVSKNEWENTKLQYIENAKQEGYSIGFQQGQQDGVNDWKSHIKQAKEIIQLSKSDYENRINSSEEVILKLGVSIAKKIIGLKLDEDQSFFLTLVKDAVKQAREYSDIQIHIHPKQYQLLLNQKEELNNLLTIDSDIYIFPNDDLNESDCFIESSFGRIDASVDTQLTEIKEKLLKMLLEE